jgi:hypothetical protein
LTGVFAVEIKQHTIPISKTWDSDIVIGNIMRLREQEEEQRNKELKKLREQMEKGKLEEQEFRRRKDELESKKFKLTYNLDRLESKGYFVIHFSFPAGYRGAIHLYRNKVQITSQGILDHFAAIVLLNYLLAEKGNSLFIDSLYDEFEEKGNFNPKFEKLALDILIEYYLDLINGKVQKEFLKDTQKLVRLALEQMLHAVDDIEP